MCARVCVRFGLKADSSAITGKSFLARVRARREPSFVSGIVLEAETLLENKSRRRQVDSFGSVFASVHPEEPRFCSAVAMNVLKKTEG